jgi:hypothetical protein
LRKDPIDRLVALVATPRDMVHLPAITHLEHAMHALPLSCLAALALGLAATAAACGFGEEASRMFGQPGPPGAKPRADAAAGASGQGLAGSAGTGGDDAGGAGVGGTAGQAANGGTGGTAGAAGTAGTGGSPGVLIACGPWQGGTTCQGPDQICCLPFSNPWGNGACLPAGSPGSCQNGSTIRCSKPSDCPSGQICCGTIVDVQPGPGEVSRYRSIECRPSCSGQDDRRICDPADALLTCEQGESCEDSQILPQGYQLCR